MVQPDGLGQLGWRVLPVAYIRYMDDWVVLADSRWQLRRAIARVNEILGKLGLLQHPDKTFIGRVAAGFEFLGYHHTDKDITVAAKTLQGRRVRYPASAKSTGPSQPPGIAPAS
ncbi:reverse transcriptase domain-containing protein [Chromobacterium phragmitis]|uniref:Reverse transcriptase domain-containing protein n=1 Tax=Chromobacterium phragmitis TaxID=2202141 RepID=A0ABV0J0K0_9NEIS